MNFSSFTSELGKHKLDGLYCPLILSLSNRPGPEGDHVGGSDLCLSMGQVGLNVTPHCDSCGCVKEELCPCLRPQVHCFTQPKNIFFHSFSSLGFSFSPSFYQSQMLKKCLGPIIWRVTAGGTEITCPCGPRSPTTDTRGGKRCILPKSHWSGSTDPPSQPEPLHWRQDWGRVWGVSWSSTPPWTDRKLRATQHSRSIQIVFDLGTKNSHPFMKDS